PIGVYGLATCASADQATLFNTAKTLVSHSDTTTVVVTNCGEAAATYNASVSGASASSYAIVGSSTSAVVAPGSTTSFSVAFAPTDRAIASAMLTISGDSASGITPIEIP